MINLIHKGYQICDKDRWAFDIMSSKSGTYSLKTGRQISLSPVAGYVCLEICEGCKRFCLGYTIVDVLLTVWWP